MAATADDVCSRCERNQVSRVRPGGRGSAPGADGLCWRCRCTLKSASRSRRRPPVGYRPPLAGSPPAEVDPTREARVEYYAARAARGEKLFVEIDAMTIDDEDARELWASDIQGRLDDLTALREANERLPAPHPVFKSLDREGIRKAELELEKVLRRAGRVRVVEVRMAPKEDDHAA